MFDMPLFPSFDSFCRPPCRPPCRPQPSCPCPGEYIVKICGYDSCGNMIVSVKRRECRR